MRRFRFRLEPLLRLRAQLERAARRELATATVALQAIDQQLLTAARGRQEFADSAALGGTTGKLARALELGLARREGRLLERRRRATTQLEVARRSYLEKARELGTLEKLETRGREAWRAEVQRAEQTELDELAQLGREAATRADIGGEAR